MGILELIATFEAEYYPLSDIKKEFLMAQSLMIVKACLADMASWHLCGGRIEW